MDNPIRRAICVDNTEYENDLLQGKEYAIQTDVNHPDFVDVVDTVKGVNMFACYAYRFKDVEEVGDAWSTP